MPPDPVVRESVQKLLESLSGLDRLKRLICTELNYGHAGVDLSRRAWPEALRELLADDPLLLATAGAGGAFHVLYLRMASDRLGVADQRHLVTHLLREHPYALFVFSNRAQALWHFVNVKLASAADAGDRRGAGRQRLFRRISVAPGEPMRTATERLSELDVAALPGGGHASALEIQQCHDGAFDVEKVTDAFYQRYSEVFTEVEARIGGFAEDPDGRRRFTQRLFNRLLFVAFLQKKGWLKFQGRTDYLQALWADYQRHRSVEPGEETNFYRNRLRLLFHGVFNGQGDYRAVSSRGNVQLHVGTGPYLNGGLFDEKPLDVTPGLFVPDDSIGLVLRELLWRFNFTITEASPLEVEVAVDPEMLGRVFEELVTGRHESGSYYTPKPIVSFMCREALKGYLHTAVPHEPREAIAAFVDAHEAAALADGEAVLEALREVRACDPACGSGAYLLGMLHELLDLRAALFVTRRLDAVSAYERKLEIIQNSIFGVDIDDFAIETARLRLWLSLVVDLDADDEESVPPLPSLDFKIERGDSLAAPLERQYDLSDAVVEPFREAKDAHMRESGWRKQKAYADVERCRAAIAAWVRGGGRVEGFDWLVEFAEVFASRTARAPVRQGGFDIVLANPPYVRQELIREQKARLAANFPDVYTGMADLYVFFYARALELLAPGGMLVFISSNKWFRAAYGAKLRKHLGEHAHVLSIVDFGGLPVFKSAAAYPMIFVAEKSTRTDRAGVLFAQPASLDPPYPDIGAVLARTAARLPPQAVQGSEWRLASAESSVRTGAMTHAGVPLGHYVGGRIYYGVKTGLNDAFVIDGETRRALIRDDPGSADIIKPVMLGKDVHRWRVDSPDRWLIFTRRGIDIARHPAVHRHLAGWRSALEPRPRTWPAGEPWPGRKPGSYRWYEIQDEVAYHEQFALPKIVFPDIAKEPRFAFDRGGAFVANTGYVIPVEDFFLLAVLNSSSVERFYADVSAQVRGGYLRFIRQYVERIPIPRADPRDREEVAELAVRCVEAGGGTAVAEWEAEIDDRVASLYGLGARERAA